jgi:hypothetical protein
MALLLTSAVGCSRIGNQDAAIERAIEEHLGQRADLAMDKMVLEMQQVTVAGDHAEAEVIFRTTMDPPARMTYHYELYREGGRWRVESGRPAGMETPHPSMGESAGESPHQTGESNVMGGLPEGHPPLPEGHPPIEETDPHGEMPPSVP